MTERSCSTPECDRAHHAKDLCKPCYRRKWHAEHREHESAANKRWRESHPDERRTAWAQWYEQNATREFLDKRAQESSAYYRANRDDVNRRVRERRLNESPTESAERRARRAARRRALYHANLEVNRAKCLDYTQTRNARKRGGATERVDFPAVLAEHGMTCHICGGPIADRSELHFDHVVPLARGGAHAPHNIRPAHALCNLRKGARAGG